MYYGSIEVYYRGKKFFTSVFDLFPLTYMRVDIYFRLFSDKKAERTHLRHKKVK